MRLQITLRHSDARVVHVELGESDLPAVFGRDGDLARVVVADHQASRAHCRLVGGSDGLAIEDLASRNGTWINDQRITRAPLQDGDRLRIGGTLATIVVGDDAGPDPLVGATVHGLRIEELIGEGKGGRVYRAHQLALNRPVAVKVMADELKSDPAKAKAFIDEARRAGRLNHPNVVQVHDILQHDGDSFIVMELLAGAVGDRLAHEGPLPEVDVLRLLADIARALAYAASQGLVHRDVKPDNILLAEDGSYKLADLGIAAHIGPDGTARQERAFGSPHYIAPEQARGGAIDPRADLYALGATAWHLLTGSPLFDGSVRDVIAAHLHAKIPDLRKLAPHLSGATVQTIAKLLEKDPVRRHASADELVGALARIRPAAGGPPRPATTKPVRRFRRRFRRS